MLVVFCLRCRARVAPLVVEFDNELSFKDRFLFPEPPVGRKIEVELEVDLEK